MYVILFYIMKNIANTISPKVAVAPHSCAADANKALSVGGFSGGMLYTIRQYIMTS